VRCLFLWKRRPEQKAAHLYEERITLWQATGIEEALVLAEQEAKVYSSDGESEFLDFSQAYWLTEPLPASGVEVFSLLRESDLVPSAYIDAFFDSGAERTRT